MTGQDQTQAQDQSDAPEEGGDGLGPAKPRKSPPNPRDARLSAQLRANLTRRKARPPPTEQSDG